MKRMIIVMMALLMPLCSWSVEEIFLNDGVLLSQKMSENEVFFKACLDIDVDGQYLYMALSYEGFVFKIDMETGKLAKIIASRGQGPGEVQSPSRLDVKNGKVFVIDYGYRGIKIFTTDGVPIREFKIIGYIREIGISVDDKEHIYVGKLDFENKTMVSVYDLTGKRLRSLIKHDLDVEDRKSVIQHAYKMDIDKSGNIYILFHLPEMRIIKKYDNNGKLIWERKIKNRLLGKRNTINDFIIMDNYDILIGHHQGGCVLDKEGILKKIIITNPELTGYLEVLKVFDGKIVAVSNYKNNVVIFNLGGKNEKAQRQMALHFFSFSLFSTCDSHRDTHFSF